MDLVEKQELTKEALDNAIKALMESSKSFDGPGFVAIDGDIYLIPDDLSPLGIELRRMEEKKKGADARK